MSRFDAEEYTRFRIHYPESLFFPLKPYLFSGCEVLDVGSGTGFAAISFLGFFDSCKITLIEPDLEMHHRAKVLTASYSQIQNHYCAPAESLPVADRSCDVVVIASAWHWMRYEQTVRELERVLRPGGVLYVVEYRFPRVKGNPGLNEWIRRQFNLYWKAENQTPRGSLFEITSSIRSASGFSQVTQLEKEEERVQSIDAFCGMIYSQSRFLNYESSLALEERSRYRAQIKSAIFEQAHTFSEIEAIYPFQGFLFRRRP